MDAASRFCAAAEEASLRSGLQDTGARVLIPLEFSRAAYAYQRTFFRRPRGGALFQCVCTAAASTPPGWWTPVAGLSNSRERRATSEGAGHADRADGPPTAVDELRGATLDAVDNSHRRGLSRRRKA